MRYTKDVFDILSRGGYRKTPSHSKSLTFMMP